ncbi:hypothetical protein B1A75_12655 [Geobacillus sp. LEMMY01]|nr:hypothetical protein B1A75_12655 [Geobacillus sp. LEMMY01]
MDKRFFRFSLHLICLLPGVLMNQSKPVEKALFPAFLPPSASGSLADWACSRMPSSNKNALRANGICPPAFLFEGRGRKACVQPYDAVFLVK